MIKDILLVGLGGFMGSTARYALSECMKALGHGFPWGTLAVNVAGSFLIGLIGGMADRHTGLSAQWVLVLTVGVCGGFTTFSTFSKESLLLLQSGHHWAFAAYVVGSVLLGLAAAALGLWLVR